MAGLAEYAARGGGALVRPDSRSLQLVYLDPVTYPTITLDGEHVLKDNGVGDYDFFCYKTDYRQWIPIMVAATMINRTCPACGATGLTVPEHAVCG